MGQIRLQFVMGRGLSSQAIAWFSAGTVSHVDAVLPDGRLLGARFDKVGGQPPGVRIRPPNYEPWKSRNLYTLDVTPVQESRFYDFLTDQLGKPYDFTAIFGFGLGR